MAGEKGRLGCSTNLSVKISWFLYDSCGSRSTVFNGMKFNDTACPRCSLIQTLPTQWDIQFVADFAFAKVFECVEPKTASSTKASITVLSRCMVSVSFRLLSHLLRSFLNDFSICHNFLVQLLHFFLQSLLLLSTCFQLFTNLTLLLFLVFHFQRYSFLHCFIYCLLTWITH